MISDIIAVLLIVYAASIRPELPGFILQLFESGLFRVLILSLILYLTNHNLKSSVLMAVGFVVTLTLVREQVLYEGFAAGLQDDEELTQLNDMPV